VNIMKLWGVVSAISLGLLILCRAEKEK